MAGRVSIEEARRGYDLEKIRKCDTSCYPSVVDRYYRKLYKINLKGREGEDYCVLLHSNRICLITLAPSHPILKEKKTVTKVDFQINKRTNRLQNPLSGKRKRGAQQLVEDAALCVVKCDDGSTYQPCGCIKGSLIEANENLVTKPYLLSTKPNTEGYIAIVLTKLQDHKQEIAKLLTPEQYNEKLQMETKRTNGSLDNEEQFNASKEIETDNKEADCDGLTKCNQTPEGSIDTKLATNDKDATINSIHNSCKKVEDDVIKDADT